MLKWERGIIGLKRINDKESFSLYIFIIAISFLFILIIKKTYYDLFRRL